MALSCRFVRLGGLCLQVALLVDPTWTYAAVVSAAE